MSDRKTKRIEVSSNGTVRKSEKKAKDVGKAANGKSKEDVESKKKKERTTDGHKVKVKKDKEDQKKRDPSRDKKGRKEEKNPKKEEKTNEAAEEEEQQYEDDFEQYESDFEDFEEEEVEQVDDKSMGEKEALPEQPESILLRRLADNQLMASEAVEVVGQQPQQELLLNERHFALERQTFGEDGVDAGTENGGQNNQHLVQFFMEMAGKGEGRAQVSTQTVRPDLSVGSQTDAAERSEIGTQSGSSRDRELQNDAEQKQRADASAAKSSRRLGQFLRAAGQLFGAMAALSAAEESALERSVLQHNSNLAISSRYSTFSLNTLFKESRLCAFAVKDSYSIALCVFVPNSNDPGEDKKSFIGEFPLDNPGVHPTSLLRCEQEVTVCRYSPDGSALFAGLKDGSIVLWDLNSEQDQSIDSLQMPRAGPPIRVPCFDTAFVAFSTQNEKGRRNGESLLPSAVVAIDLFGNSGQNDSMATTSSLLAHLVTLHEFGSVCWWTALYNEGIIGELDEMDGSLIKIVRVSTSNCFGQWSSNEFATCMTRTNSDSHVLVGSTSGRIVKIGKAKSERMEYNGVDQEEVTSLKWCEADNEIFAATTSAQRILLYDQQKVAPLRILCQPAMITSIGESPSLPILFEWAPPTQRTSVLFYSIHSGKTIFSWRFDENSKQLRSEACDFQSEFRTKINSSSVWQDHAENIFMAFLLTNGEIHVHCMERKSSNVVQRLRDCIS